MATLTCYLDKDSNDANGFRGIPAFRGCPLSPWDRILMDKTLKDLKVNVRCSSYTSQTIDVVNSTGQKIKGPIDFVLTVTSKSDETVRYETFSNSQSDPEVNKIRDWASSVIRGVSVSKPKIEPVQVQPVVEERDIKAKDVEERAEVSDSEEDDVLDEIVKDKVLGFGLGLGGAMFVVTLALAGIAIGSYASDRWDVESDEEDTAIYSEQELDPDGNGSDLFMVGSDGRKPNFNRMWDEQDPRLITNNASVLEPEDVKPRKVIQLSKAKDDVTSTDTEVSIHDE